MRKETFPKPEGENDFDNKKVEIKVETGAQKPETVLDFSGPLDNATSPEKTSTFIPDLSPTPDTKPQPSNEAVSLNLDTQSNLALQGAEAGAQTGDSTILHHTMDVINTQQK